MTAPETTPPTPWEVAAARDWFSRPVGIGPYTEECVRVLLAALDAETARADELQRKGEEVTAFAGLLLLRHPTAENLSPELAAKAREFVSRLDAAEARATAAEKELGEARAATKRLRQSIGDLGDCEDLVGCDGNKMLEEVLDCMERFDADEAYDAALPKEVARG